MAETLYEILAANGHRLTRHDGQFGIEIETETNSPYSDPPLRNWRIVPDGSLRNYGREYVLAAPMSFGKGLEEALEEFATQTKNIPFNQGSNSTSVHVHINMLNETARTLMNTLTTYSLLEPLLISACGEERKSNLFCLPFHDAGGTVHEVQGLMMSLEGNFTRHIRSLNSESLKYSGLNIAPLRNLGSIEVRTMEGTTDTSRITEWIKNFQAIVDFSRNPELNPVEVLATYLEDKDSFLERLGIPSKQFSGNISELLHKGRSVAYDFAVSFYDWEKVFKSFDANTKKSRRKKDEAESAQLDGLVRRVRTTADVFPASDRVPRTAQARPNEPSEQGGALFGTRGPVETLDQNDEFVELVFQDEEEEA